MRTLALLLAGYSVFSALQIMLTHFRAAQYRGVLLARSMGLLLLIILISLQMSHFAYLAFKSAFIHTTYYQVLLFAVAPLFYLFSKPLLQAQLTVKFHDLLHVLPILLAPFLPWQAALALAFLLGVGYLIGLMRLLYALRAHYLEFKDELCLLSGVFLVALFATALGLTAPLDEDRLVSGYTSTIGIAFFLINIVLYTRPQLTLDVLEAAHATYAVSTLKQVDCAAKLVQLANLMDQEEIFKQPELDLAMLAQRLNLSSLQLAELIKQHIGKDFSRYLREYRVEAAEDLLMEKPSMPLASVGLAVGFETQAHFNQAFKQITGMTPEQFRKLHHAPALLSDNRLDNLLEDF